MYIGGSSRAWSALSATNIDSVRSTTSVDKVDCVCDAVKSAVEKIDADR